jgi:hypothetical protein
MSSFSSCFLSWLVGSREADSCSPFALVVLPVKKACLSEWRGVLSRFVHIVERRFATEMTQVHRRYQELFVTMEVFLLLPKLSCAPCVRHVGNPFRRAIATVVTVVSRCVKEEKHDDTR